MKTKKQIANKMLSGEERKTHVPVFDSKAWQLQKARRHLKVIQRVKRATVRRLEREIAKENGRKVNYSMK